MQTGKKKLILDHLIVQKMDDESGSREDVQSILLFGAKALFEETEETVAREVHCKMASNAYHAAAVVTFMAQTLSTTSTTSLRRRRRKARRSSPSLAPDRYSRSPRSGQRTRRAWKSWPMKRPSNPRKRTRGRKLWSLLQPEQQLGKKRSRLDVGCGVRLLLYSLRYAPY